MCASAISQLIMFAHATLGFLLLVDADCISLPFSHTATGTTMAVSSLTWVPCLLQLTSVIRRMDA